MGDEEGGAGQRCDWPELLGHPLLSGSNKLFFPLSCLSRWGPPMKLVADMHPNNPRVQKWLVVLSLKPCLKMGRGSTRFFQIFNIRNIISDDKPIHLSSIPEKEMA